MSMSFDRSTWLLFDALASGRYAMNALYKEPADYEGFFNRPWHGMEIARLQSAIADLTRAKYLNVQKSRDATLSVALTPLAGHAWEREFNINWDIYFDCAQRSVRRSHKSIADFMSPSEVTSWKVVNEFMAAMMDFDIAGSVVKGRTIMWQWSPWKVFPAASCFSVKFDAKGNVYDRAFDNALLRAEKIRRGWRKSSFAD